MSTGTLDPVTPAERADGLIECRRQRPRVSSLDELVGLDEIKTELRAQIRAWAEPETLARLGGSPRSGMLFLGPTGTGKTTAANALAAESGRPLYTFAGPDFHDAKGKDLLATVLAVTSREPAIVFIDEADDLVHKRDFRRETSESLVKYLLVGLDRTTRDIAAFIVLASNLDAGSVDRALCHPGRLGRPIPFRRLDHAERLAVIERRARTYALDDDVNLALVASRLVGLPTASVANVLDEAAFVALRRGATTIDDGDLHEAVTRLQVGLPRQREFSPAELRAVAIHEAGHALVAIVLAGSWREIAFVSVDARAEGNLGSTSHEDDDDETILTDTLVRHSMAVGLAGREAERIVLHRLDSGAASDLASVNGLARRAVKDWGFSRRGPSTADDYAQSVVDGRIDEAAGELVREAERTARQVLDTHRPALELLADRLVEHRRATSRDLETWLAPLLPEIGAREGAVR
jgi:cell division protease FtsH